MPPIRYIIFLPDSMLFNCNKNAYCTIYQSRNIHEYLTLGFLVNDCDSQKLYVRKLINGVALWLLSYQITFKEWKYLANLHLCNFVSFNYQLLMVNCYGKLFRFTALQGELFPSYDEYVLCIRM